MKYYILPVKIPNDKIFGSYASQYDAGYGWDYVSNHMDELIEAPSDFVQFATVGYMQGSDFVIIDNIAYQMKKTYSLISEGKVIYLCIQSADGSDMIVNNNVEPVPDKKIRVVGIPFEEGRYDNSWIDGAQYVNPDEESTENAPSEESSEDNGSDEP